MRRSQAANTISVHLSPCWLFRCHTRNGRGLAMTSDYFGIGQPAMPPKNKASHETGTRQEVKHSMMWEDEFYELIEFAGSVPGGKLTPHEEQKQEPPMDRQSCQCWCGCRSKVGLDQREWCDRCHRAIGTRGCRCWFAHRAMCHCCAQPDL